MRKSPFPGMDPFLEPAWRDVHQKLCVYACDDIQSKLGDGMLARIDERLVVELSPDQERSIYPDVRIIRRRRPASSNVALDADSGGLITIAEPLTVEFRDEELTEAFIEIIDARSGGRVITSIEFVSATNKMPGKGRDAYLEKQRELRNSNVSTVEVNLVRAGQPLLDFARWGLAPDYRTAYHAIVHRAWAGRYYEYYPMPLERRLPVIGIPLRETDALVPLDLQSLIDRVYRNGAYDQEIDYSRPLHPPLEPEEAEWVEKLPGDGRSAT